VTTAPTPKKEITMTITRATTNGLHHRHAAALSAALDRGARLADSARRSGAALRAAGHPGPAGRMLTAVDHAAGLNGDPDE
jgi:hypothetical protein